MCYVTLIVDTLLCYEQNYTLMLLEMNDIHGFFCIIPY